MEGLDIALPARPEAIIFDFDGVILESAEIKAQAFAEIYADSGEHWREAILDYQRKHGGVSRREKFRHFDTEIFGIVPDEQRLRLLSNRFSDIVVEKILSAPFVPGAVDLLEAVQGRSRLFVVSGTPQDELVQIVRQRALSHYFEAVIGAPATKHAAFRSILKTTRREATLAIGDSSTECLAACEVGIAFLGIRNGPSPTNFPAHVTTLPDLVDARRLLGF